MPSNKQKEEEIASVTSHESCSKQMKMPKPITESNFELLAKLLVKPSYIELMYHNKIVGNFGHGSAMLKRPIA